MSNQKITIAMATFKSVIFDNHLKLDGTTNIKIRIYHNKVSNYLPTPYYIYPEEMGRDGNITSLRSDSDLYNFELGCLLQKYRGICLKLGSDRISRMSCNEVKEYILSTLEPDSEYIDFVEFSNQVIDNTKKTKTAEWYEIAINSLCWFYGKDKIDIREITGTRMNEYVDKLFIEGMNGKPLKPGGISNYLRAIRALHNKAKKKFNNEDHDIIRIPNSPFSKVKIPKYKRSKKSLSVEDIKKIRDGHFSTMRANMARDVFMMMFYMMGININDLYNQRALTRGRVEYERNKTQTEDNIYRFPLSIKIEPELQELTDHYTDIAFLSYFRRNYNNSDNFMRAVNKGLEKISHELNLGVKITTNWARHSWASIARNKAGIPTADIDFCLGHVNKDYKMADIYIEIDYSIFDKTNRKVLDLLKKKSKK